MTVASLDIVHTDLGKFINKIIARQGIFDISLMLKAAKLGCILNTE